ncbi:hypothetical protein B0H19DRAFT_1146769 [Mycena capillaripes]|nr:hypothetical protein B0H19DRAFT_1146769 [Mycena capillaripes]
MNVDDGPSSNPTPNGHNGSGNSSPTTFEQRLANVESQLQALTDALKIAAANPAPSAPAVVQAPPSLVVTTQAAPQFTPPTAPLNSPAGASPSLRVLFPDVEPACITAVITHELKASDLYKLDVQVTDSKPTYSLSATGTFEMNEPKHKPYKNPNSILSPLHVFFAILAVHLPARSAATVYFYRYLSHLATLATDFEWAAVVDYHTLFFNRRRRDMLAGSYDGWATPDVGLLSAYVFPRRKQTNRAARPPKNTTSTTGTEPCRNCNAEKCETPCAWERLHVCSSPGCGKDHPLTQHK